MNNNIKAGADLHAGDGGYSVGTKEKYDEFVKGRNQSLGKMRIRELAEQAGLKYYNWSTIESNIIDGDFKYPRLEDYKKFAELIVRECIDCADIVGQVNIASGYPNSTAHHVKQKIREHFGVEE